MTDIRPPVPPAFYVLFVEDGNNRHIRKWSSEPFYGAQKYVLCDDRVQGFIDALDLCAKLAMQGEPHV